MIFIASDHAGFEHKKKILKSPKLKDKLVDLGPFEYDSKDNYPDFVALLVEKIKENPVENRGIILCSNGVGVSVMANKFKDIRCGLSWDISHVQSARLDDAINVLALPAGYICARRSIRIIEAFLNTPFSNEERHNRRLNQYKELGL